MQGETSGTYETETETDPMLNEIKDRTPLNELKSKRNQVRNRAASKMKQTINKTDDRFKKAYYTFICCFWTTISIIGYVSYNYVTECLDDRYIIDNTTTVISEKLIDHETPGKVQVNCTNDYPCRWNCTYIDKHFHKTPDECTYHDNLNIFIGFTIGISICFCCQCVFGGSKETTS